MVTGGAGFIGSHLVELLVEKGFQVTVFDNLSTGHLDNIKPFIDKNSIEYVEGNILDLNLVTDLTKGKDFVFHLAAAASVSLSIEKPRVSHDNNVTGTLNVLIAAKDNNVKKVIFASSCAVYGDNPELPLSEESETRPLSPYAVSKLSGEYYCNVFTEVYRLPTVSLRYFNVFGPRQNPESEYAAAIPKFISRIVSGQALQIYGDGEQTRDFIFVKDIAKANLLAAESDAIGCVNLAGGREVSINLLVGIISDLMNSPVKSVYQSARVGDIKHSVVDITRLQKILRFQPDYSLEEGLKHTINYFRRSEPDK